MRRKKSGEFSGSDSPLPSIRKSPTSKSIYFQLLLWRYPFFGKIEIGIQLYIQGGF